VNTPTIVLPISPMTPKDRMYGTIALCAATPQHHSDCTISTLQHRCSLIYHTQLIANASFLTPPSLTSHGSALPCSDLEFALTLSIDWVALSFVQKPEDILELRALAGPKVKVRCAAGKGV
jgi:hypothetical protein